MFEFFLKKEYNSKEIFFLMFFSCLLFVFPLILSDSLYMDDKYRLVDGAFVWEEEGRYLTTLIYQILGLDLNHVFNFFPLTLFIGIAFFSYSISYIFKNIKKDKTLINIMPFLFLIIHPFFLQNLSYQFDSISHLMSIGCILISFFYTNENKKKQYSFQCFLFIIAAFLYQPSVNIFLVLFVFDLLFDMKVKNDCWLKNTIKNAIIFVVGLISYYIVYMFQFNFIFDKIYQRNQMIKISSLFDSYNISTEIFYHMVEKLEGNTVLYLILFLFLTTLITVICKTVSAIKNGKNYLLALLYLSSPILLYISLWGPFIFLNEKFFNPRDYISLGAIITLSAYSLIELTHYFKKLKFIFLSIIILNLFSISYLYGNLIKYNDTYMNYVNNNISRDIELHPELQNKKIFVFGRQGTSRYAQMTLKNYPLFGLIFYPDNSNFFKSYDLYVPYVEKFEYVDNTKEWNYICKAHIQPYIKTETYEIYSYDKYISIWYKRKHNFCDSTPTDKKNSYKLLH